MAIDLDRLQQRIVGVLIEKQLTVPDAYPLTMNALVSGCSQKSNRDPHMEVEDYEIEGALRGLMDNGWVTRQERDGGRAQRYAHESESQLGVERADLAILSELLCRGPQAPGALKARVARMHPVGDAAAIESRLRALATRPVPYVTRQPKRPREQAPRWCHLLDGRSPQDAQADTGREPAASAPAPAAAAAPQAAHVSSSPASVTPAGNDLTERVASLEVEVLALRRAVQALRTERESLGDHA